MADVGYHFSISDQVETAICAVIAFQPEPHAPARVSQGWMLQALPSCDLELFDTLRRRMEAADFKRLAGEAADGEEAMAAAVQLLGTGQCGYRGMQVEQVAAPHFACTCSKEKMLAVLRAIPIPDRMQMVKAQESTTIRCQFCARAFTFTIEDCIAAWNVNRTEG